MLHEAGYKCSNPTCRGILTIDIHHLDYVSDGGSDSPDNLIALCPTCHALHHKGHIPKESLKAWKIVLLTLNQSFDRGAIDLLLLIDKYRHLRVTADGVLTCASLIVSGLAEAKQTIENDINNLRYLLLLTEKGRLLVEGWKQGNEQAVAVVIRGAGRIA